MAKQQPKAETTKTARETLLEGLDMEEEGSGAPDAPVDDAPVADVPEVEETPAEETPEGGQPDAAAAAPQAAKGFLDKVRELGYEVTA